MPRYYVFYKPYQVMSQFSPVEGKRTLADYLDVPRDVYPVGRLDYDSEGLLLLTNDTSLNQRLLDPKQAHPRTYYVQVEGTPTEKALEQLRKGVEISIDGKKHRTLPAEVTWMQEPPVLPERHPPIRFRAAIPTAWLSLTLREGKNRQVRRMTAAVGLPTLRLVRYRLGRLDIRGLQPGDYAELNAQEIARGLQLPTASATRKHSGSRKR